MVIEISLQKFKNFTFYKVQSIYQYYLLGISFKMNYIINLKGTSQGYYVPGKLAK